MKGKILSTIARIMALWLCFLWYSLLRANAKASFWLEGWTLNVLTSIDDEFTANSVRCWTFQLIRNDIINEMIKKDVEFSSQPQTVKNLNKQTFKSDQISPNVYYNNMWLYSLDFKTELEEGVKSKFQQDINLPDFLLEWWIVPQNENYYEGKKEKKYGIYTILKKTISLDKIFEKLDKWIFLWYSDIDYFWINCNSNKKYDQVKILYYNSNTDFAVSINTKWWDEIIYSLWTKWTSFLDTYYNILMKERNYTEEHEFTKFDCLKIPNIDIKFHNQFRKLERQKFRDVDNRIYRIEMAIQNVEINLDNPSWLNNSKSTENVDSEEEYRYLYFDRPFVVFIKEADKDLPYAAAQVSDIKLFQ